eukprot:3363547-Rhodomonas_salina.1
MVKLSQRQSCGGRCYTLFVWLTMLLDTVSRGSIPPIHIAALNVLDAISMCTSGTLSDPELQTLGKQLENTPSDASTFMQKLLCHCTKWMGRISSWLWLLLLLASLVRISEAAPVANRAALDTLKSNCLNLDPRGHSSAPGDACDLFVNADTSSITDMNQLFYIWPHSTFNADLSKWDVSSVTSMFWMFNGAASSFNADISKWDTSCVTNMQQMFGHAGPTGFNADISKWDVSKVRDMATMFFKSPSFNADLSRWDTSSVTSISRMFYQASTFNADISKWDTSSVTGVQNDNVLYGGMTEMFLEATAFNADISKWDTSSVNTMRRMFQGASAFNVDISKWDVSSVTFTVQQSGMEFMFEDATAFDRSLCSWSGTFTADTTDMFAGSSPKTGLCCRSGTYADSTSYCSSCPAQATCAGEPAEPVCSAGLTLQPDCDGFVCAETSCNFQFSPEESSRLACASAPFDAASCQVSPSCPVLSLSFPSYLLILSSSVLLSRSSSLGLSPILLSSQTM